MTQASTTSIDGSIDRSRWAAALLRVEESRVIALAETLAERHGVRMKRVPKSGLAMMRLRDSVQSQAFNLGEIPLSSAHVVFNGPNGTEHEGGCQIMRDHEALAVAIAVCDGVLAAEVEGTSEVASLVCEGAAVSREDAAVRRGMRERSRVSFALMNQQDESGSAEGGADA
ncbi:phosphonate C-P lyase system protein PhnG [Algisphaera agarilytica]|uniref:Alpha-D-ribose 1-methylphosphonate 5-triphosphate synthase subunit PhnG n=1 Tax=Algisphaera agarilytica TaxID=1385975 RepID=A0A7X0LLX4_9BACT|nr:phosphonate C-P lyase system protein PhnG [Algisphaera agarilytica]MBB6431369.1 alpha-D-ribose 1-methylphosphonate 5-triphosphate synthase subunit PhnG [Algisphaera agarilytica]